MFSARVKLKKAVADIALASPSRELQERLRTAFKEDQRYDFCAIDGSLASLAAGFDPATGPSVLIADLQDDRAGAIAAIEHMRREKFDGAIVTISDNLDEEAVRGLLRWRIADWLPSDASTADIVVACERAMLAQMPVADKTSRSLCVSLIPAAGGAGTTTLAIETAFLLARRDRNHRSTCLIDLNFQAGALADYLDLKPGFKLDTVARAPERLDAHLLEVMLSRHESGIAVLAAPRSPTDCINPDPALVTRVLSVAADLFQTMIVDMPPIWQPWSNDVLAGSDRVYVVTEFTVPALRKAQELTSSLHERLGEQAEVGAIINKYRRQLFGNGLKRSDAEEMLGARLAGFVAEDYGLVRDAINRGKPIGALRRSNRIAKSLADIVAR
jgi:pilus assembly protein CpaE